MATMTFTVIKRLKPCKLGVAVEAVNRGVHGEDICGDIVL